MTPEADLAVLPNSKEDALSMREIALASGLDISSNIVRGRTNRHLSRPLRSLINSAWVDFGRRPGVIAIGPGIMLI